MLKKAILTLLILMILLSGCAKASDNQSAVSNSEETYPKIAYIEDELYYGTDTICEMVPRKMPDGVIETFVDKEIMPDSFDSANFGSEYSTLEYMFLDDGRLIIHIGEDWFYFEKR